jgi:nucleoside-diphosphate-sugar epimerase
MKVLVFGATGMLGRAMTASLLENPTVQIIAPIREPIPEFSELANFHSVDATFYLSNLSAELGNLDFDAVVNCAVAYGHNGTGIKGHLVNVDLPLSLAKEARRRGVPAILFDTFLNKFAQQPERHRLYAAQKKLVSTTLDEMKSTSLTLQLEHIYGPYDRPGKFVHELLNRLAKRDNSQWQLRSGVHVRDFTYVRDISSFVRAILGDSTRFSEVLSKANPSRAINLGTGIGATIREIVGQAETLAKHKLNLAWGGLEEDASEPVESIASIRIEDFSFMSGHTSTQQGLSESLEWLRAELA